MTRVAWPNQATAATAAARSLLGPGAVGTVLILVTYALLASALTGLGLAVRAAFDRAEPNWEDVFLAFWMGLGLVLVFLMLWHFVAPVNPAALLIVLASGVVSFLAWRPRPGPLPRSTLVAGLLFTLWVAHLSTGGMQSFDTSLYHMQGVKWVREHAIVPGLANLFGPLAFNNVSFLYDAMLDAGPFHGRAWHICNGLLVGVLGLQMIVAGSPLFGREPAPLRVPLFALVLLAPIVNYAVYRVTSFGTVEPAGIVLLVVILQLYRLLVAPAASADARAFHLFAVMVLAAVAVTIKASAAVFAAGVVATVGLLASRALDRRRAVRVLRWSAGAIVLIAVMWVARGIVLSGYPMFPGAFGGVAVEWRAPREHALAETRYIIESAHGSAWDPANPLGSTWSRTWLRAQILNLYDFVIPVGLFIVSSAVWLWRRRRAYPPPSLPPAVWLLPALGLAVLGWLLTAPMARYGAPFFWGVAAWMVVEACAATRPRPRVTRGFGIAAIALGTSAAIVTPAWEAILSYRPDRMLQFVVNANVKRAPAGQLFQHYGDAPTPVLTKFTTRSGLVLNVPVGRYGRCWDQPLPCTLTPAPNLRLRDPARLDRGFVVDGEWQMIGWPDSWTPHLLPALRAAGHVTPSH
jgi:hypothetical protein